ncbi:hypothetical protein Tco_0787690 [Tanacetum coccineum]
MAKLAFCDYHNMVAILEKTEHNADFHQIVDFLEASHIRTVSESSIRRHLKLNDEEVSKSKEYWRLTRGTIQISQSKVPLPGADETASPTRDDIHKEAFPTATSLDAGQDRENIAKTSAMPHESSPRVTYLDGGKSSMQQKLQELMDMCTNLQQQHLLMEQRILGHDLEITQLKNRVKTLEDNEKTREGFALKDAPNTGGMDQGEDLIVVNAEINNEKSTKKESDSTYEMANVLSTLGAANVLSSGITTFAPAGVATASGSFPTAVIFTTTSVTTPYTRKTRASRGIIIESSPPIYISIPFISKEDKGKGIMTEPENLVKQDETASPTRDDRHREAFPTATSLDAGQDRENIAKTSVMPHESSPRVTSLDGGGGNLEITQLKNRVKTLEDNEKIREGFAQEDAPNIGGMDQGEDLRIANDLSTLGATNILSSGITTSSPAGVATASGNFPTAAIFTTTSVTTPYTRKTRDSRGIIIESSTPSHSSSMHTSIIKEGQGKRDNDIT